MIKLVNTANPSLKLYTIILGRDGMIFSYSFLSSRHIELNDALKKFVPNFDKETDRVEMDCVPFHKLLDMDELSEFFGADWNSASTIG